MNDNFPPPNTLGGVVLPQVLLRRGGGLSSDDPEKDPTNRVRVLLKAQKAHRLTLELAFVLLLKVFSSTESNDLSN